MRKVVKLFLLFFTFNTLLAQTVFKDYTDGMVYVKFTKVSLKSISNENPRNIPLSKLSFMGDIFKKYGVSKAYKPFYQALDNEVLPYIMKFEFSDITRVTDFISELSKLNGIEYAEKVPIMKIDVVPNDPTFPPHLTQINAANAWNVFNGSSNITVAIVDNAIM
jgi:serine protease